jgi:hypothetical protein
MQMPDILIYKHDLHRSMTLNIFKCLLLFFINNRSPYIIISFIIKFYISLFRIR